jgi:tRNA pseudouridine55 synthase
MRGKRRKGRNVDGVLLLNKPQGLTSNAALQAVKRIYQASKAGHTGSLDPLASGLLPICLGRATKVSAYLLNADKRYQVRIRLGQTTTTGDAEGEPVETLPVVGPEEGRVREVLAGLVGEIEQVPPMYSAVRHQGRRLYQLAREGIEVERQARSVRIYSLVLVGLEGEEVEFEVHCSKGTYIRTLAEQIGERMGCGAHVVGLRRTRVGPFESKAMVAMEELERHAGQGFEKLDQHLLPIDSALVDWPKVQLSGDTAFYVKVGQAVVVPHAPTSGWVRLYTKDKGFFGVGQILPDGKVAPRRLIALE